MVDPYDKAINRLKKEVPAFARESQWTILEETDAGAFDTVLESLHMSAESSRLDYDVRAKIMSGLIRWTTLENSGETYASGPTKLERVAIPTASWDLMENELWADSEYSAHDQEIRDEISDALSNIRSENAAILNYPALDKSQLHQLMVAKDPDGLDHWLGVSKGMSKSDWIAAHLENDSDFDGVDDIRRIASRWLDIGSGDVEAETQESFSDYEDMRGEPSHYEKVVNSNRPNEDWVINARSANKAEAASIRRGSKRLPKRVFGPFAANLGSDGEATMLALINERRTNQARRAGSSRRGVGIRRFNGRMYSPQPISYSTKAEARRAAQAIRAGVYYNARVVPTAGGWRVYAGFRDNQATRNLERADPLSRTIALGRDTPFPVHDPSRSSFKTFNTRRGNR